MLWHSDSFHGSNKRNTIIKRKGGSGALSIFASKGTSVKKNLSTQPNEVQRRTVAQVPDNVH